MWLVGQPDCKNWGRVRRRRSCGPVRDPKQWRSQDDVRAGVSDDGLQNWQQRLEICTRGGDRLEREDLTERDRRLTLHAFE